MRTSDLDYHLPADRIAQEPIEPRDASRLLHCTPDHRFEDRHFSDVPSLLRAGDLLVANDTRVRRSRLRARADGGRDVEVLVLERVDGDVHRCLVRPGRAARPGTSLEVSPELRATVVAADSQHPGARLVRLEAADVDAAIQRSGSMPLPPYIHRDPSDPDRYQTTYADGAPESAAAPTAGLHFTERVIRRLHDAGIGWTTVRLQVGLATFAPIRADDVEGHVMHEERFEVPQQTADTIARVRRDGGRVIAVGTTVVRTLESCANSDGLVRAESGTTQLFIRPGHRFRVIDGLLTNFHQPRSSLLVLLAAFMGVERVRAAYDHALTHGYRFLSFGDCMLCWRGA